MARRVGSSFFGHFYNRGQTPPSSQQSSSSGRLVDAGTEGSSIVWWLTGHDTQTTQRLKLHPMLPSLTSPPHHPPRNSLFFLSPPSQPQVFRRIRHISFPNHLQSFKPGLETNVWRCVGHQEYKAIHRKCNPCTLFLRSLLTWLNYLNICASVHSLFFFCLLTTVWILSVCMSLAVKFTCL